MSSGNHSRIAEKGRWRRHSNRKKRRTMYFCNDRSHENSDFRATIILSKDSVTANWPCEDCLYRSNEGRLMKDAASLLFVCFWLLMQMLDDTGPEKVSNNKMGHLNKMIYSLFWQICIKLALPRRRMCTKRSLYASCGPLWAFDFVSGNGEYAIKQRFQNTFKVLLKLK